MARVARLAGALLLQTGDDYFLIGQTKEPCAFGQHGFAAPTEIAPALDSYCRLTPIGPIRLTLPQLLLDLDGEAAARLLAQRLLIQRNASVSERLWSLLTQADDPLEPNTREVIPSQWLAAIPGPIWEIVRETVLRCS